MLVPLLQLLVDNPDLSLSKILFFYLFRNLHLEVTENKIFISMYLQFFEKKYINYNKISYLDMKHKTFN